MSSDSVVENLLESDSDQIMEDVSGQEPIVMSSGYSSNESNTEQEISSNSTMSPDSAVEDVLESDSEEIMEDNAGQETIVSSSAGPCSNGSNLLTPEANNIQLSETDKATKVPQSSSVKRKAGMRKDDKRKGSKRKRDTTLDSPPSKREDVEEDECEEDETLDSPPSERIDLEEDEYERIIEEIGWYTKQTLNFWYQLEKDTFSDEQKEWIEAILKTIEEKDCSLEIAYIAEADYVAFAELLKNIFFPSTEDSEKPETPTAESDLLISTESSEKPGTSTTISQTPNLLVGTNSPMPTENSENLETSTTISETSDLLPGTNLPIPTVETKTSKPPTASSRIPHLSFTNLHDELRNDPTGEKIVEMAKQWEEDKSNLIFNTKNIKIGPGNMPGRFWSSSLFSRIGFPKTKKKEKGEVLPVVVFDVSNGFDEETLEEQATKTTCCIIRGFDEAVGMDYGAFEIETIANLVPDQNITTRRDRAQPVTSNYTIGEIGTGKAAAKKHEIKSVDEENGRTMKEFTENFEELLAIGKIAFDKLRSDWPKRHEILAELEKELKDAQFELNELPKVAENVTVSTFGTNVDLNPDGFPVQMGEIDKLPKFLRPGERMFAYCHKKVLGVNEPQMYFKSPGCRTPGHVENQVVASINLNLGPGDCIWYCVPAIHSAKLQAVFNKKKLYPYNKKWWIHEDDLKENGVSYQKIIQKKGDLVYVGIGTSHWVQSNGYCANVSWNVAQMDPVQLMATAVFSDQELEQREEAMVPFVPMLWEYAINKVLPGTEFSRTAKQLLVSCLARAQFESSGAKIRKCDVLPKNRHRFDLENVVVCCENKSIAQCSRIWLFNMVVCQEKTEGAPGLEGTWCIYCGGGLDKDIVRHVQQRYSIKELIKIFNDYDGKVPK